MTPGGTCQGSRWRAPSWGEGPRASDFLVSSKCSSAEEMVGKVGQDYRGKTDGRLRIDVNTFSFISVNVK